MDGSGPKVEMCKDNPKAEKGEVDPKVKMSLFRLQVETDRFEPTIEIGYTG